MTYIQRLILQWYFRYFKLFIGYAQFIVKKAKYSKFWYGVFCIWYYGIVKNFYHGFRFNAEEAKKFVSKAHKIIKAECICGYIQQKKSQGNTFYINEAAELYRSAGPMDYSYVDLSQVELDIETAKTKELQPMIVHQRMINFLFPGNYVLCLCDDRICIPQQFQRDFPEFSITNIASRKNPNSIVAHLLFFSSLPLLTITLGYYLWVILRPVIKIFLDGIIIIAVSAFAGWIISKPSMWHFLHNQSSSLNQFLFIFLPIIAFIELFIIYGILFLIFIRKNKYFSKIQLLIISLNSLILFETVQLIRFCLAYQLNNGIDHTMLSFLFWSFDILAWLILIWYSMKQVNRYNKTDELINRKAHE